jgi:Arc/MetJ family transcription regulator
MRTTITLDPDVAAAVARLKAERAAGVSEVVNDLVRRGLAAAPARERFVQDAADLGAPTLPIDDIGGLLDALEGDDHR